jgi:hypothetical protein
MRASNERREENDQFHATHSLCLTNRGPTVLNRSNGHSDSPSFAPPLIHVLLVPVPLPPRSTPTTRPLSCLELCVNFLEPCETYADPTATICS